MAFGTQYTPQRIGNGAKSYGVDPTANQTAIIIANEKTRADAAAAAAAAAGQAASSQYAAIPGTYGAYAGMLNGAGGNIAQMFDSYGRNAGQYFNAIGNIGANAMASGSAVNTGLYSAYGGANNAYQATIGNLGAAALAGYGNAANSAMQAQAANSTAYYKAMSDAMAANQSANATYGIGRDQALAGLAAALGTSGANLANAYAQNAASAGKLGGDTAGAFANLGGSLATAAGNVASSRAESEAAMRGTAASALGQLGTGTATSQAALRSNIGSSLSAAQQAQAQGLAGMSASSNAALAGLGAPMATAAANDLTYTRDMAKLGLGRELGLAGTNAISGMSGGSSGPIALQMSGPQGTFASGSAPSYSSSYSGGGQYVNPYTNVPWYAQQQQSDKSGLRALGGLQSGIQSNTSDLSGSLGAFGNRTLGLLDSQAAGGSRDIADTFSRATNSVNRGAENGSRSVASGAADSLGAIDRYGMNSSTGIAAALASGNQQINAARAGIDNAANNSFAGINAARNDITSSGVLDRLADGYYSGISQLGSAYQSGRQDPVSIFDRVRYDMQGIASPFMDAAGGAMGDFYKNFPQGPAWGGYGPGGVNPTPFLQALSSAWDPYMSNLNSAYGQAMGGLGGVVQQAGSGYRDAMSAINGGPAGALAGAASGALNTAMNGVSPYIDALGMTPAAEARLAQDQLREAEKYTAMDRAARLREIQNQQQFSSEQQRLQGIATGQANQDANRRLADQAAGWDSYKRLFGMR